MVWAVLLLLGVIVAVHWFIYNSPVQEYTFAQPATVGDVRGVQGEKTPIVLELGQLPWRPEVAEVAGWAVEIPGGASIPVSAWLKEEHRPAIQNESALTEEMGLTTGLGELDESRAWWWLPGLSGARVGIQGADEVAGLSWVGAERRWFGVSAGAPVVLWLVHSRFRRFLPEEEGADPWRLTVAEAPWIGRVQFVEVRVRPGWCVGLPAHWGYAVRVESEKEGAWWWSAEQHSPLSRLLMMTVGATATEEEVEQSSS
jgi:hypothetical protein